MNVISVPRRSRLSVFAEFSVFLQGAAMVAAALAAGGLLGVVLQQAFDRV
jgi:purine-cytosine permease-like protein